MFRGEIQTMKERLRKPAVEFARTKRTSLSIHDVDLMRVARPLRMGKVNDDKYVADR